MLTNTPLYDKISDVPTSICLGFDMESGASPLTCIFPLITTLPSPTHNKLYLTSTTSLQHGVRGWCTHWAQYLIGQDKRSLVSRRGWLAVQSGEISQYQGLLQDAILGWHWLLYIQDWVAILPSLKAALQFYVNVLIGRWEFWWLSEAMYMRWWGNRVAIKNR